MPDAVGHVVVVTSNFPCPEQPFNGAFVRQFAHAIGRAGVKCTVISPVAVHRARSTVMREGFDELDGRSAGMVEVFRPRYLSVSTRGGLALTGGVGLAHLTLASYTRAVQRVLVSRRLQPDALYGHFLYLAGAAVCSIARITRVPAFVAVSESSFWTVAGFGWSHARRTFRGADGFVAGSASIARSLRESFDPAINVLVAPNGVDGAQFYPRDRIEMRRRFGLPEDKFLVAAVGTFRRSKGIWRVAEAIEGLDGVAGVYAGAGPCPPRGSNTAFVGELPPERIPELLSACDVFALPTEAEGSCNAIVEALACGLPVVSANRAFNDDVLDARSAVRIDPTDIPALRAALRGLRDNAAMRATMSRHAREASRNFELDGRARRILAFMRKTTLAAGHASVASDDGV